uniref:Uncharacterized protein n=1 Tax=Trichogramma kaykai TaxID=54128 RepID=A0ABD2X229_9HYME
MNYDEGTTWSPILVQELLDNIEEYSKENDRSKPRDLQYMLKKLNTWIKDFSYDVETNKPPKLTLNNQRQMLNIKYSASEMICLVKYLSLIIKDFVPKTGKHWEMFMELRNIVDIVLSPRIIDSHLLSLAASIKKLNTIWIELYDNLKPKFHFMTHYPTVISNFGPPVNYWAMRFESKHCDIKANAQATHSHRDLLHTISIKQSLQFAHYFNVTQAQQPDIFQLFSDNSNGAYTKIQIGDTIFNIESFIVLSLEESEALFAKIVKIEKNVYIKESDDLSKKKMDEKYILHLHVYEELFFDPSLHAYVVKRNSNLDKTVNFSELPLTPTLSAVKYKKDKDMFYIIPKSIL